jgi:hypothetical protein
MKHSLLERGKVLWSHTGFGSLKSQFDSVYPDLQPARLAQRPERSLGMGGVESSILSVGFGADVAQMAEHSSFGNSGQGPACQRSGLRSRVRVPSFPLTLHVTLIVVPHPGSGSTSSRAVSSPLTSVRGRVKPGRLAQPGQSTGFQTRVSRVRILHLPLKGNDGKLSGQVRGSDPQHRSPPG